MEDFWEQFRLDPREPANASMRAGDADRELVRTLLDEAYADGRLTHDEHGQRVGSVLTAVTLADLPPVVSDLVPTTSRAVARRDTASLDEQARAAFGRRLRDDLGGAVALGLVLVVVWLFTGHDFFWPIFPILVVSLKALDTLSHREAIIEKERAKLERKQLEELRRPDEPQADA